ncbi:hypothetical protein J6590_075912 [Homalodisca vitripennis]|nr:hypothetical protein J6590_075912 [Homalodisca vitripennis]
MQTHCPAYLGGRGVAVGRPISAFLDWIGWFIVALPLLGGMTELNAQNPYSWFLTGGGPYPQSSPPRISCQSGSSAKVLFRLSAIS